MIQSSTIFRTWTKHNTYRSKRLQILDDGVEPGMSVQVQVEHFARQGFLRLSVEVQPLLAGSFRHRQKDTGRVDRTTGNGERAIDSFLASAQSSVDPVKVSSLPSLLESHRRKHPSTVSGCKGSASEYSCRITR